jgi:hypothetical protein
MWGKLLSRRVPFLVRYFLFSSTLAAKKSIGFGVGTTMAEYPQGSYSHSVLSASERRTHPRRKLNASVELIELESGSRLPARLADLAMGGCGVLTSDPLPLGAAVKIEITKDTRTISPEGRVVSTHEGKGMGLEFVSLPAEDMETLAAWLDEALGNLWLASNRRTSQRIQISIPVRATGKTGAGTQFEELAKTLSVAVNGGPLLITTPLTKGQRIVLSRPDGKHSLECVVVYVKHSHANFLEAGVSFIWPSPKFWGVTFPPEDWSPQHPDAKRTNSRSNRGTSE